MFITSIFEEIEELIIRIINYIVRKFRKIKFLIMGGQDQLKRKKFSEKRN